MSPEDLIRAAAGARGLAYCPYSGYPVGAAIEAEDGAVFTGVNVENVSYGATMCAERSALFTMVAQGRRRLRAVAVVTRDGGTPCGLCLQALLEFAPEPSDVTIFVARADGPYETYRLSELFPHGFRSAAVARTEGAVQAVHSE